MKNFTAYHAIAFAGVLFIILCADGLMDMLPGFGYLAVSGAVMGAAALLWRHGEDVLYYENKRYMRRKRRAEGKRSATGSADGRNRRNDRAA